MSCWVSWNFWRLDWTIFEAIQSALYMNWHTGQAIQYSVSKMKTLCALNERIIFVCIFFTVLLVVCILINLKATYQSLSFSDGAALWTDKLRQHLLHECHSAMSALGARAQNCTQKVTHLLTLFRVLNIQKFGTECFKWSTLLKYIIWNHLLMFHLKSVFFLFLILVFALAEIVCFYLQVLRCSPVFRGKCTLTVYHSRYEAQWLVCSCKTVSTYECLYN